MHLADVTLKNRGYGFIPVVPVEFSRIRIRGQYARLHMRHTLGAQYGPGLSVEQEDGLGLPVFRSDIEPRAGCDGRVLRAHEGKELKVHVPNRHLLVVHHQHHQRSIQAPPQNPVEGHHLTVRVHARISKRVPAHRLCMKLTGELPEVGEVFSLGSDYLHGLTTPNASSLKRLLASALTCPAISGDAVARS